MRKLLLALTACVLCAAPLRAQAAAAAPDPAPTPTAATAPVREEAKPAPSLYPTSDEIRQQLASTERERARGQKAAVPNDFLYLVAAIVVGVVIAAVILD
jgi:hypothetical protein